MNILVIGDVVGTQGCQFLRKVLPRLKREKKIDFCVANGENSAEGNGITPSSAQYLFDSGVDVITTGNHVYRRKEILPYLEDCRFLVRPANYPAGDPGTGAIVADLGKWRVGILNLQGNAFLRDGLENAFSCADRMLETLADCKVKLVDFHAESTGEKRAMGFYLDGRVSAVFGTHTHTLTADEQILPGGTGYITDIGMTGPKDTVLGVAPEIIIRSFKTAMPQRFLVPDLPCYLCGCIFAVDPSTGKTLQVERICINS